MGDLGWIFSGCSSDGGCVVVVGERWILWG